MEPETCTTWYIDDYYYISKYFRKEQDKMTTMEPRKFWMITGDGNAPKVRHFNRKEAVTEAERLARAYPGVEFFIMETVEMMTQPTSFVRHKF
jgi:hypothetical protein